MDLTNYQLCCNQIIKTIDNLVYLSSFWPFCLQLQRPNQVLASEASIWFGPDDGLDCHATSKAKAKD